jgi:ketosteroid isomerase-like protein
MIGAIIAKKETARAFQCMNNHDLPGLMSYFSEDCVFIYPGEIWASGTNTGKPAVQEWFTRFFAQFREIRFDILQISAYKSFAMTGTNVITVHWDLYLTNRTGRVGQNSGVNVITLKAGKIIHDKCLIFDMGENYKLNWSAGESV